MHVQYRRAVGMPLTVTLMLSLLRVRYCDWFVCLMCQHFHLNISSETLLIEFNFLILINFDQTSQEKSTNGPLPKMFKQFPLIA